jgi:hypothetical protein
MKGTTLETNELVEQAAPQTKPCQYPSCGNTIPMGNEFPYCEVCRVLAIRNSITITQDPTAPFTERHDHIFARMITLMRPEEILLAVQKAEASYLAFQKEYKACELSLPSTKRTWKSLELQLEEARGMGTQPKVKRIPGKKRETKKEKLTKQFGGNTELVEKIFGDDYSDL